MPNKYTGWPSGRCATSRIGERACGCFKKDSLSICLSPCKCFAIFHPTPNDLVYPRIASRDYHHHHPYRTANRVSSFAKRIYCTLVGLVVPFRSSRKRKGLFYLGFNRTPIYIFTWQTFTFMQTAWHCCISTDCATLQPHGKTLWFHFHQAEFNVAVVQIQLELYRLKSMEIWK